jgi:DNA-binding CsgD family transcriptional regulator
MPRIVGRDTELAVLREVLSGLRNGRGQAVLVKGEAGIGKSALLSAALAGTDLDGVQVLSGACDELTQRFPLSAVTEVIRPGTGPRLAGHPGPAAPMRPRDELWIGPGDPVHAAMEQLLGQAQDLCAERPLVLILEDLHWADEASLLWWRRLCQITPQLPLVLVGTRRPVPRAPGAETLEEEVRGLRGAVLTLDGLPPDAVQAMTADLVDANPGPRLLHWLTAAGGNPFFIRELVDEAARTGSLHRASGQLEIAETTRLASRGGAAAGASTRLNAAVESRLDFLPDEAARILRIAALLGHEFPASDLAAVCEQSTEALMPALDSAVSSGILEVAGPVLRFRHELLRQALYDGVPAPVRAALHQQAARTLHELGAPAERTARQLLAVPDANAGEGWEVKWVSAQAVALVTSVPQVATELLTRVLCHAPPDPDRNARLEGHLLDALFALSRYEEIAQRATRLLPQLGDPHQYGRVAWLLVYAQLRTGRPREADDAVKAAFGQADLPAVWRARFLALRAMVVRYFNPGPEAAGYAAAALAAGRELDDAVAIAYALHAQSIQLADNRDLKAARRLINEALPVTDGNPQLTDLRLLMVHNLLGIAGELGDFAVALDLSRDMLTRTELSGLPRLSTLRGNTAFLAYELGRWDEAMAELDASAELEWGRGVVNQCIRVLVLGHRDAWLEASRDLADLRTSASGLAPPTRDKSTEASNVGAVAVLEIERSGELSRAGRLLEQWLEPELESRVLPYFYRSLPTLVRLCRAAGDEAGAQAAAEAAEREAARAPMPRKQAVAQWCRGLLDSGDAGSVEQAGGRLHDLGLVLEAGNAFEDAAVLLARAGQAALARTALARALDHYGQLGAAWDARRAVATVRPFGIRMGVRGLRRRPQVGWLSLTDMELQVARLVAGGYSNPSIAAQLFLSRRTVESHVSHILAKLQISSRREVAELATSRAALAHRSPAR